MKKQFMSENEVEIKNLGWALWVCLIATAGFIIAFLVLYRMGVKEGGNPDKMIGAYLLFCYFGCAGYRTYACIYEKLSYSSGVYAYRRPFGKTQIAKVGDIRAVKILTFYYHTKYGISSKVRVFFYDKDKNILIKIIDDSTLSKNETFIKSLKFNCIKVIHEENTIIDMFPITV